jgi:lysophospholipase L1-like esterase
MSWIKKNLPILLSLLLTLGLFELGSYGILKYFDKMGINKAGLTFLSTQLGNSAIKTTIIPNPYSLYWNNPEYTDTDYGKIYNSLGYRSIEESEINVNSKRIFALGGSTTNVYPYVKDNSKIWTYLVETTLNENKPFNYHVINAGLPYGTTAELLSHYIFKGKYTNPDYVIYHGGGNDMMPLFFQNYQTDYSHVRWSEAGAKIRSKIKTLISKSNTLQLITSLAFTYSPSNGSPPFNSLNPDDVTKRVQNQDPVAFRENLEVLASETQRHANKLFLIGFLQAKKENLTRNRSDLIGFEDGIILAVEKHDEVMRSIAEKYENVYFLKLNKDKFKEEWFLDNCHLTEEGEMEKAKQIVEFIEQYVN